MWNAINGLARYLSTIESHVLSTSVPTSLGIFEKHPSTNLLGHFEDGSPHNEILRANMDIIE